MNPMDCKQAQNVWSRVMAAQTAALCTNAEKAPEKTARAQQAPAVSITPEQVMQAMHEELCDAEPYPYNTITSGFSLYGIHASVKC